VEEKAANRKITLDSMLLIDAGWVVDQSEKQ